MVNLCRCDRKVPIRLVRKRTMALQNFNQIEVKQIDYYQTIQSLEIGKYVTKGLQSDT